MKSKVIISKTIMFILIVAFIVVFKSVFGSENILVGVTTITAMLMLLQRDLTAKPIKNTIELIMLNLLIGIATTVAASNMWLGIPINFIMLFILGTSLCHSLRRPMYLPFSLQYLFLLATPVSGEKVYIRLVSLVVGAIFIMALQLIVNRNKFSKVGNKILIGICDGLLNKVELIKEGKNSTEISLEVKKSLNSFRNIIYDKREDEYYLTEEGRVKLNLIVALEELDIILNNINYDKELYEILSSTTFFIEEVKKYIENDKLSIDLKEEYDKLLIKYEETKCNNIDVLNILNNIMFLVDTIVELSNLNKENYNLINKLEEIPRDFKNSLLDLKSLKNKSLKFSYSIRIAIGISASAFIVDYFNIPEGKWVLFTILSLVNPLYEISKQRSKDRIIATIIGGLIIAVLFSVFTDDTSRTLILLISGYISNYLNEYKYTMICATVSAVGAAALISENANVLTMERIIYVIIGMIIALLINRFILPYKLKDSNEDLFNMYKSVVEKMRKELLNSLNGVNTRNKMKNLLILTSLIEDRLKLNNQALDDNDAKEEIVEHRLLVSGIYELYVSIIRDKVKKEDIKAITKALKDLSKDDNNKEVINKIKDSIYEIEDIKDKLILARIVQTLLALEEINKRKTLKLININ